MTGIFECIPGQFEHEDYANQTKDGLGDVVLNEEGQSGESDDGPGGVTDQ